MWIFTPAGFYSVVQHRKNHSNLLVRARSEADLLHLLDLADRELPARVRRAVGTIESTLHRADYPFRVTVSKKAWKRLLAAMTDEVNYDNFKTAVGKKNKERAHTYMSIWSALLRVEREPDASVYAKPKAKAQKA